MMTGAALPFRISVIIPTRNRERELQECLQYLVAECRRAQIPTEIVIIDTSAEAIELPRYPDALGVEICYHYCGDIAFSMVRSRNVGLRLARAAIIAYIDDDCYVRPGWLTALLAPYESPGVAAVGGRIIYHPWKEPIREGPIAELNLDQDRVWAEWDRKPAQILSVPHLPGGNFSVLRSVALQVRGFDTNFIGSANLEETDFFVRVAQLGSRMVFNPAAVVEHRAAPRADGLQRNFTHYLYRWSAVRNRLYFLRKHRARKGVSLDIRRQLADAAVGTGKLLRDAVIFMAASLLGIVAGLFVKPQARHEGWYSTDVGDGCSSDAEYSSLTILD